MRKISRQSAVLQDVFVFLPSITSGGTLAGALTGTTYSGARFSKQWARLVVCLAFCFFPGSDLMAWSGPIEWLGESIDQTRNHRITPYTAWHARLQFFAWGVLLPLGVLIARYCKIWPGQRWPQELDRQEWWHAHLFMQSGGAIFSIAGVTLVYFWVEDWDTSYLVNHRFFGWLTMVFLGVQIVGGLVRGSKGGPTHPAPDGSWQGDHYSMTPRRKLFEYIHKTTGYLGLFSGWVTIILGLWAVNAPRWMWIVIIVWWLMLLVAVCVLQMGGRCVDTYQAIWGPDSKHPGNTIKPIGIGVQRGDQTKHS